jgi:arginyl-tRNA synthetase
MHSYAFVSVVTSCFDINESVSIQGNSGPYLQYAHARASSILAKASAVPETAPAGEFDTTERALLQKLTEYTEVVEKATNELLPHTICNYLYELSQAFNHFYEHAKVIGDDREVTRLWLVEKYRSTLAGGLEILGIVAPERL